MKLHKNFMCKTQWIWAFILLPLINISALFLADPIHENITHIAYAKHHFLFVLLWACTCAYYLWCNGAMLIERLVRHKKSCHILLLISCTFMVISVIIPYDNHTSALAKLHVRTAMGATISYIVLLFYVLCQLYYLYPQTKRLLNAYLSLITILCLLFLLTGCISTLIEVSFVIFMGIFYYMFQREFIHKTADKSISES